MLPSTLPFDGVEINASIVFNCSTPQSITFNNFPIEKNITDNDFEISAYSSSNLPITYSVLSGPASIINNLVHLEGTTGVVTIAANQSGDNTYCPAPEVTRSFKVVDTICTISQTITFDPISDKYTSSPSFVLSANASSGYTINFNVKSGPAFIENNMVKLTGYTGPVIISANQAGDNIYCPADEILQSFNVNTCNYQSITFDQITDKRLKDTPFTINATSSSGLPITFTIKSGPANLDGSTIYLNDIGTITISAEQIGNETYCEQKEIQSFNVIENNTGVEENRSENYFNGDIIIYPNPTNNKLNIEFVEKTNNKIEKVSIFNMLGKLIYEKDENVFNSKIVEIDCSNFDAGIYFLNIVTKEGTAIKKFSVVR